jgi:phenylpropionate dioxygenase-like ring-hydroxylating dioxygenase large terminal subunit
MLTKEDNEILTRVGPGTPMGNLMRQYWMPSMMSSELPSPDSPPVRIRILGENLIAFRTTSGKVGVIQNACPHRGASLFFGRNEEEGLRCVYHGWKFDVTGQCTDMPSEPAESNFKSKIRATAYPTEERSGLVWMYMGPREVPPPLPELEANMLPEGQYVLGAYSSECNWLQSLEGDYDTIHLGFLHQGSVQPEEVPQGTLEYYVLKNRWARMTIADTEFGCTYGCNRPAEEDSTYWRLAHFLFPFYAMIPTVPLGTRKMFIVVVPIDDENCLRFHMNERLPSSSNGPALTVTPEYQGVTTGYHDDPRHNTTGWLGRFNLAGNIRNDYLIDRDLQKANKGPLGYSGIPGRGQDGAVTESMGVIYQRDNEHLGVTDAGLIRMRRLLIRAAKALRDEGTIPPGVDNPQVYRARSGAIVLPNGVNGILDTKELQWKGLTEEPQKVQARV